MKKQLNLKLLVMVLMLLMVAAGLPAQKKQVVMKKHLIKPDLDIVKVSTDRDCNLVVVVKNNGPGMLPARVYSNHHPKSAGVYVHINGKRWGGQSIWKFDPGKRLKRRGGFASCTLNYKVSGSISVKAVVDMHNVVMETNENNNARTERLNCKSGLTIVPRPGGAGVPQRFFLDFKGAYLVLTKASKSIQIITEGNVLSYGSDWKKCRVSSTLFHLKQNFWSDFYWEVNTALKKVYRVKGGQFCKGGGIKEVLAITVDNRPDSFFLRFSASYLVYVPSSKSIQIITEGNVLSYGSDWDKCNMKSYLYHLRLKSWKGFYWKVNTSRKKALRIKGGQFCKLGGSESSLNMGVRVVN
ncbi:MAG: hypothetical protein GY757_30040 [bacterium]|nr:hypothetical protein [bacterium]